MDPCGFGRAGQGRAACVRGRSRASVRSVRVYIDIGALPRLRLPAPSGAPSGAPGKFLLFRPSPAHRARAAAAGSGGAAAPSPVPAPGRSPGGEGGVRRNNDI